MSKSSGLPSLNKKLLVLLALLMVTCFLLFACDKSEPEVVNPPTDNGDDWQESITTLDPVVARDEVLEYIKEQYPEVASLIGTPDWEKMPEPAMHALAVFGYKSGDWRINLTLLPAHLISLGGKTLEEDTFDIGVRYTASPPPYILWQGRYAEGTGVEEILFVNRDDKVEAVSPEEARDIVGDLERALGRV